MWTFASKLIVASVAALLVLPVGWCCASSSDAGEATVTTPAAAGCCSQHSKPPSEEPAPHHPVAQKCCCHYEATPPGVQKLLPEMTAAALFVALPVPQPVGAPSGFERDATGPPQEPPHRVLHCVWRL